MSARWWGWPVVAGIVAMGLGLAGCRDIAAVADDDLPANSDAPGVASQADDPLLDDDTGVVHIADEPGLPHFGRVTRWLYRGGTPTAEGLARLKAMGIGTVIDLRGMNDNRQAVEAAGMNYSRIPMYAWSPSDEAVVEFLKTVAFRDRGPFYVHCWLGSERTAFMTAMYRMVYCGWDKAEAIAEMTDNGYNQLLNQQQPFAERIDLDELRQRAAIPDNLIRPRKISAAAAGQ